MTAFKLAILQCKSFKVNSDINKRGILKYSAMLKGLMIFGHDYN